MKKTLYTLQVNDYAPKMAELTLPFMQRYAKKIGADFYIIKDRKYPDLPPAYEKFQVYELSKERGDEWSIFLDLDVLVHPDFWDITACLPKDTTCSGFTSDFTPQRFKPDEYFLRDGRFIGKGNWMGVFSDWCRDYFRPLDDITPEEAVARITPIENENATMVNSGHLIDDYVVSRNIARYGLKHTLVSELKTKFNTPEPSAYMFHEYTITNEEKMMRMYKRIFTWAMDVYTYLSQDGRMFFKPSIEGSTPEEKEQNLIIKEQALIDGWLGQSIPELKVMKTPNPEGLQTQTIEVKDPVVQIVDGKAALVGDK